jgi:polar amino acid transport system substrate-binding protein/cystine transport system substrate-binding protein/membrane-bound lytic murein transglycosylase F
MQRLAGMVKRHWSAIATVLVVAAIIVAVSLLPADTSLSEVRRSGVLSVCVPSSRPPLVTADAAKPGLEIEMLTAISQRLGVALRLNVNPVMGTDFNPANWHINRAGCAVVAGGVIASSITRSFLDTSTPYLESGWAIVMPAGSKVPAKVGFFPVTSGLDRVALARLLRAAKIDVQVVDSANALVAGIKSGSLDAGVTEAIMASEIAGQQGWRANWVSDALERDPIAFGLWKGDLTLKRAIDGAIADMQRSGQLQQLIARYDIVPVGAALVPD